LPDILLTTKVSGLIVAENWEQSPNIEQTLTLAMHEASKELRRLNFNYDQSLAIFSRARGIGEQVLRQARAEAVEKTTFAEPSATTN
jgi:hypothetical protein